MQQLETWLVNFIQSKQFPWIMLMFLGLICIELILHHKNEGCRRVATGISACFGMFCVYVLTAVLFGPIHHSLLERLQLSACLPFLSDTLISNDWKVFSILNLNVDRAELCYGILKLFMICIIYNFFNDLIEKSFSGKKPKFIVWALIQAGYIFVFTIFLSSLHYIKVRLEAYFPGFGRFMQFAKENAVLMCVFVGIVFLLIILTKAVFSQFSKNGSDGVPVLGMFTNLFFENIFGVALVKAAVTTYFLMLLFKIITITYIKDFVFSSSGKLIFLSVLLLIFIWYMVRGELYREKE